MRLQLAKRRVYYQSELDPAATPWPDALVDSAISGMMQQVQDDYTVYLEPVENAPLAEAMSGEYEGIGIWVDYPDGRVRVIAPMPGSPAEAAGLLPNDVITAVDGVQLTEENDANVSMIRGRPERPLP
ncbi:MAG: PDZ domain-containing protein [Thermomicrobiales bacterium]